MISGGLDFAGWILNKTGEGKAEWIVGIISGCFRPF